MKPGDVIQGKSGRRWVIGEPLTPRYRCTKKECASRMRLIEGEWVPEPHDHCTGCGEWVSFWTQCFRCDR